MSDNRLKTGAAAGLRGIFLNLLLFSLKLAAGIAAGSVALRGDAFNNLGDLASSATTFIGFRVSAKKADREHPFGHGRYEYIAGLVVAILILFVGGQLLIDSVKRVLSPGPVTFIPLAAAAVVFSIAVKAGMFLYYRNVNRRIGSVAVAAAAADSRNDVLVSLVVLCSYAASGITEFPVDGYAGAAVALFILYSGIRALLDATSPLIGKEVPPEMKDAVMSLLLSFEDVLGAHDLLVHSYGPVKIQASIHAEMPQTLSLVNAHHTLDLAERTAREKLGIELVIHLDPVDADNPEVLRIRQTIKRFLLSLDTALGFHDLRLVQNGEMTDVCFDLAVPYRYKLSPDELVSCVTALLVEINPKYRPSINTDRV